MSRQTRRRGVRTVDRRTTNKRSATVSFPFSRRLKIEPLEVRQLLSITVNTLVDENDGVGVGGVSLRDAVVAAMPGETIEFESSLTSGGPATILLTHGELLIDKNLTISGPGANALTIDASGIDPTPLDNNGDGSRIFRIDDANFLSDKVISISGLTLRGGDVGPGGGIAYGGAIVSFENIMLNNMILTENHAVGLSANPVFRGGGAVFLLTASGTSVLSNLEIVGNVSTHQGGGLDLVADGGARIEVIDCLIDSNHAGDSGGGMVLSSATGSPSIHVVRTTVTNNIADGLFNNLGGAGIATFSRAPGAVVSIVDCTVAANTTAGRGGGINVSMGTSTGSVLVRNTTISGNHANLSGGGISVSSNLFGVLAVDHSTIANNTLAAIPAVGDDNAAGIQAFNGNATITNSIVAGNVSNSNSPENAVLDDIAANVGSTLTFTYSLIGANDGESIVDNGGNLIGTPAAPIDPLLDALADNGGATLTHALVAGSPAIDAGDPGAISAAGGVPRYDQRGAPFVRVADGNGTDGARIDMGAFELSTAYVVDTLVDESDGDFSSGDFSLREAIELANGVAGEQAIGFAATLTIGGPATILLTLGQLTISDSVAIGGPAASRLTIDASGNDLTPDEIDGDGSRIFNINDGNSSLLIDVSISGLTLTGGDINTAGGAIFTRENLTIADSVITGNATTSGAIAGGGGIYSRSLDDTVPSSLTVLDSAITNNVAVNSEGGGIRKRYGSLTIERSTISGNSSAASGGGVSASDGGNNVQITDSAINDNTATGLSLFDGGGGLFLFNANSTITGSTISGNSASLRGGGIYNYRGDLTVAGSTISGNSALHGGGIDSAHAKLKVIRSTIHGNTAAVSGGGIRSNTDLGGTRVSLITGSTISGNMTSGRGGGVYNFDGQTVIEFSTITNNSAAVGQGSGVASRGNAVTRTEVYSSIVAGNIHSDVDFGTGASNSFQSQGNNVIGAGNATSNFNQPGDQAGVLDPGLTPLQNNGGTLLTHALVAVSVAIDAGNPGAVAGIGNLGLYDQRDAPFSRITDGDGVGATRIDVGAIEFQHALVVDRLGDENDGNYSAGDLSLREAIELADTVSVVDGIGFAASLNGQTILLNLGELVIRDGLEIIGPGASLLAIDASGNDPTPTINNGDGSRVFLIDNGNSAISIEVSIQGLTITGGDISQSGGGILAREDLTVSDSVVTGNASTLSATGAGGGGIYSHSGLLSPNSLTIVRSSITGNVTNTEGGGIRKRYGFLMVEDSTISGNTARVAGGGISASDGGVDVYIIDSTISGNTQTGTSTFWGGGGLFFFRTNALITGSTISGNTSARVGGGLYTRDGEALIRFTTVTNNVAPIVQGGGIASRGITVTHTQVQSSIVAGNTNSDVAFTNGASNSFVSLGYNLIGTGNATGAFAGTGDQIGVANPLLGPLVANGGPTKTHALLPGSPALDAGDPSIAFSASEFDQRGAGFARVANAGGGQRIDIGAYESQGIPSFPAGDHNHDGITDAADYVMWRKMDKTPAGYSLWRTNFGNTTVPVTTPASAVAPGSTGGNPGARVVGEAFAASETARPQVIVEGAYAQLFAPSDGTAPVLQRETFVRRRQPAIGPNHNQMLLALDQAIAELDHDWRGLDLNFELNDTSESRDEVLNADDSLAVELIEVR